MIDIILLLAGSGNRMGELTKTNHKSLLEISKNETFLSRILHQLNELQINTVHTVVGYKENDILFELDRYQLNFDVIKNENYRTDTNINSMLMAIKRLSGEYPVMVIEGDVIMDDYTVYNMYLETLKDKTSFFTRGLFNSSQYGGVIDGLSNNRVKSVKILSSGEQSTESLYKMSGVMSFSRSLLSRYMTSLELISCEDKSHYYLEPWLRGEFMKETFYNDYPNDLLESCNTPEDYYLLKSKFNQIYSKKEPYQLVEVNSLRPIEEFIPERIKTLKKEILDLGLWIKPLIVEKDHRLILDGHHRFEVAKLLGLKQVPVVIMDYSKIKIWSLRNEIVLNHDMVRQKALEANIFPNKTVKHDFRFKIPVTNIKLNDLK